MQHYTRNVDILYKQMQVYRDRYSDKFHNSIIITILIYYKYNLKISKQLVINLNSLNKLNILYRIKLAHNTSIHDTQAAT